jgi:uncharacterized short protein YbdD (DUF466 family)
MFMLAAAAIEALVLLCGLISADGYETMMSHLGPDKRVSSSKQFLRSFLC